MRILRETNIDFMSKRKQMYVVSAVVILVGLASLFTKGIDYGIDFLGGTELVVEFNGEPDIGRIREMMNNSGYPGSEIKTFGVADRVLIRTLQQGEGTIVADQIKEGLRTTFSDMQPVVL
ncbi:MAG TPA: hypothetical protein VLA34_07715, partial [Candidatus Krumholzibacterium sp.]|nr:hypothetical protein [Candidatus Krumholzibacterium sp.]